MIKVDELKKQIVEFNRQITEIQSECNHPKSSLQIKHNGSTGGWESDSYWKEYTCGLCKKFWIVDEE